MVSIKRFCSFNNRMYKAVIKATNTVWTKCHVRAVIKPVKAVQTEGPAQRTYVCPFILRSQFASCDDDEVSSSNS